MGLLNGLVLALALALAGPAGALGRPPDREAAYAIERTRTQAALAAWRERPLAALVAAVRWASFEWGTGYGLYPFRALQLLLQLQGILWLSYLPFIYLPAAGRIRRILLKFRKRGAIHRVWPDVRLVGDGGTTVLTYSCVPGQLRAHRLETRSLYEACCYALHLGLLSALRIGWSDATIGAWLRRRRRRTAYTLRAHGWPHAVSRLQSWLSVYLLALWALAYGGQFLRP